MLPFLEAFQRFWFEMFRMHAEMESGGLLSQVGEGCQAWVEHFEASAMIWLRMSDGQARVLRPLSDSCHARVVQLRDMLKCFEVDASMAEPGQRFDCHVRANSGAQRQARASRRYNAACMRSCDGPVNCWASDRLKHIAVSQAAAPSTWHM
jgi:hypothetical protein